MYSSITSTDQTLKAVLEVVKRIEDKIDAPTLKNAAETVHDRPRRAPSLSTSPTVDLPSTLIRSTTKAATNKLDEGQGDTERLHLAIPYRHTTAAEKLLSWPIIKQHGQLSQLDISYPLRVELARASNYRTCQDTTGLLGLLTYEDMKWLTDCYFEAFHTSSPVLNLQRFKSDILPNIHNEWPNERVNDGQKCICLSVFALGSLAANHRVGLISSEQNCNATWVHDKGAGFRQAAEEMLARLPKADLTTAQCFLLSGLYHSRNFASLEYYWAITQANLILMLLLSSSTNLGSEGERIYWVAHMQESGILAELDYPPSGISRFENEVPLPFNNLEHDSQPGNDWPFFFLAQIALRRLLNRVHSSLYGPNLLRETNEVFDALLNPSLFVINELNQQLEQWRCHLPPTLQFSALSNDDIAWDLESPHRRIVDGMGPHSASSRANLVGHLRARYCAAKSIIYRPFAFKVLHLPAQSLRHDDYVCLRTCLLGAIWIPVASQLGVQPLALLQNPMNPCRSFYAAAILVKVIAATAHLREFLPNGWEIIYRLQNHVKVDAASQSPIIQRDIEILELLDQAFATGPSPSQSF